ncbi:MAG: TetR/AcrR family transcriptional regulator [Pseudomonadota bacterium]
MEKLINLGDMTCMDEEKTDAGHKRASLSEERIIAAARKLFIEQGFSAVSGDELCKEARVSKTTLYKYFGDMTGVLAAVVANEGEVFDLTVDTEPDSEAAFWEAIEGYGTRLLKLLNRPFCIRLDRMLHEEARENKALAEAFYENAYGKGHRDMTALIAHGLQLGFISRKETAEDLADHLISMWEGLRFIRARLGLTNRPFEDPEEWAKYCVETLFGR